MTLRGVNVLGIDPGLANMGLVVVTLFPDNTQRVLRDDQEVPYIYHVHTEKMDKKRGVRASDDSVRRGRLVVRDLFAWFTRDLHIKVICAEAMSYPRNSTASNMLGISWGIIITAASLHDLPIVQASPQDIKKAVCGRKDASKVDVQVELAAKYGIPVDMFNKTTREHPFDALGAVEACLDSEVIRMARAMAG